MGLWDNILMALSSLRANKMRAVLTMLGIIIGIGAVIGILTVGNGLTGSITGNLNCNLSSGFCFHNPGQLFAIRIVCRCNRSYMTIAEIHAREALQVANFCFSLACDKFHIA